jgi:hypothetical protein
MSRLKEHYHQALEQIQEQFDQEVIALSKCSCPPLVSGPHEMCPHCVEEYEQHLMDNYESYADQGLILIEDQNEREVFEASLKKSS